MAGSTSRQRFNIFQKPEPTEIGVGRQPRDVSYLPSSFPLITERQAEAFFRCSLAGRTAEIGAIAAVPGRCVDARNLEALPVWGDGNGGSGLRERGADANTHAGDASLHRTAWFGGMAGLQGCWRMSGQVQGKDSPSVARGEWHLGRRYFTLHLHATDSDPYEAAIAYGAGEQPRAIESVFSDTFGGLYEPMLGLGDVESDGLLTDWL